MIDTLQRIARAIQFLRLPAIVVGSMSLILICTLIFIAQPGAGDRWLMPGFVSLLWAVSTYAFIVNFQSIPAKVDKSMRFFTRLKRNIHRAWYWLVALIFLGASLGVLFVSYRMIFVWIKDYSY